MVNFVYYQSKAGVKPDGQKCSFQPAFDRNILKCANMDPAEFLWAHLCNNGNGQSERKYFLPISPTLIPFTSFYCSYIFTPIQRNYSSCFMLFFYCFSLDVALCSTFGFFYACNESDSKPDYGFSGLLSPGIYYMRRKHQ